MCRLKVLAVSLAVALLLMSLDPSWARAQTPTWLTYTDARYGFSVSHPADWRVLPQKASASTYGSVVTFLPHTVQGSVTGQEQVVIGLHTIERERDQALSNWTIAYLGLGSPFDPSEIAIEKAEAVQTPAADGSTAYAVRGSSPITHFQLTNIARGRAVWFVWTNMENSAIYTRMVASPRFSSRTPSSLTEAFGPAFRPSPRSIPVQEGTAKGTTGTYSVISLPDNSWWVPTPAGQTFRVLCGSAYHTGTAAYAADIQTPMYTYVYSTKRSWVDYAGWHGTGYGNLVRASTDFIYPRVYTAYYAHLYDFAVSPGQELGTGSYIARSGNSGPSTVHLHFHVRSGADAVNLSNLFNFDENSYYPSGDADCGKMYR